MKFKDSSLDVAFKYGQLAHSSLRLTDSSSDCERVFSKINLIKVKNEILNRLITSTVNMCVLASQCIIQIGVSNCESFTSTEKNAKLHEKSSNTEPYLPESGNVLTEY